MYRYITFLVVLTAMAFLFVSEASSADNEPVWTQGQLAVIIVRSLGLETEVGVDSTVQGYISFLESMGITPLDGWDATAEVTKEVLAVVVVQTLGLQNEVARTGNLNDVNSYVRVFDAQGFTTQDIRKVLSNIFVVNLLTDIVGTTTPDQPLSVIAGF